MRIDPASGDAIVVLSTGPALLASELGYEWVLWRSGRPDLLHTRRALASAGVPLLTGLALLVALLLAWVAWFRRTARRRRAGAVAR